MPKNNFFEELKRRNVYRVAITYGVSAWLSIQVASILFPTFEAPTWVMKVLTIVLIIGFPIALILAWAFEMSPQGMIRTKSIEADENPYSPERKKPFTSNVIIGFLAILVIGQFAYNRYNHSVGNIEPTPTQVLRPEILNARIAVLPFKNNTNDPNLEILGDMSADWINRGLMEIEDIEVVSPFTVRSNIGSLGISPNDSQGRTSFAELTGAQNMLSGNYYLQNENIIFQLQIESTLDGQIKFIFDPIRGHEEDKEALLTNLRSQVAGYWIARDMVDSKNIQAPNYEAYVAYREALRKFGTATEYAKVVELDSSFYLARLHFLNLNRNVSFGTNSRHFDFLERHASELNNYETAIYNYIKGYYSGDAQQAFESLNNLRKKYPRDFFLNHECATIAAEAFNNPELALEIYNELPIKEFDAAFVGVYYMLRGFQQLRSYTKLEQFTNLSTFLNTVKEQTTTQETDYYITSTLYKALAENNSGEIENAYTKLLKLYDYNKFFFFWVSNSYLSSTKASSIRNRLKSDFVSYYQKLDSTDINKTYWKPRIALIEGKSQNMQLNEIKKLPKPIAMLTLHSEAVISINNNSDKAQTYILELKKNTTINFDVASSWGAGTANYLLGKIFAKLGEQEEAIAHLKESRKLGVPVYLNKYKYDIDLAALVGIPEFDDITNPIWPEVKD